MGTLNASALKAAIPNEAKVTPATRGVAHTASATAFEATRAFHALGTETIVVDFADGAAAVSLAVAAGQMYPYSITKCSTAASGIVLLY